MRQIEVILSGQPTTTGITPFVGVDVDQPVAAREIGLGFQHSGVCSHFWAPPLYGPPQRRLFRAWRAMKIAAIPCHIDGSYLAISWWAATRILPGNELLADQVLALRDRLGRARFEQLRDALPAGRELEEFEAAMYTLLRFETPIDLEELRSVCREMGETLGNNFLERPGVQKMLNFVTPSAAA